MTNSAAEPAEPERPERESPSLRPSPPGSQFAHPPGQSGDPTLLPGPDQVWWLAAVPTATPPPQRRVRFDIVAAIVVTLALAAAGALVGPLWQWLAPGVEVLMTPEGAVHANTRAETYFADDGTFLLIGAGLGVIAAIAVWMLARPCRGPVVLLGLLAGCVLCAVVAWQVGGHIGMAEFRHLVETAEPGSRFRRPATVSAFGVLLVQTFTAAFTYTLLAGWSRYPDPRRPALVNWRRLAPTPWRERSDRMARPTGNPI
ncbi:MAG: DUF2567 domain-containing protein [Micromonosporaceae bacterium]